MNEPEVLLAGLERQAKEGRSASEAARWLMEEMGEDFKFFQLIRYFVLTFDIPLGILRDAEKWSGLGTGGELSDEQLDALLGPLVLKEK